MTQNIDEKINVPDRSFEEIYKLMLSKFQLSCASLIEVIENSSNDDLIRDCAIKRFEFTYELCWKTLKLYYAVKGKSVRYARDVFKEAFSDGLISDEQLFLDMLEDRNKTVHVYNQQDVDKIYDHIKGRYSDALVGIFEQLGSMK